MISKLKRKTASFFFLLQLRVKKMEKFAYAVKIYFSSKNREAGSKTVYFNFPDQYLYNRYYYNLVKYFLIEGYTVYTNMDLMTLYYFASDEATYRLLKEPNVIYGRRPAGSMELGAKTFNRDYFGSQKRGGVTYYVPLGQHPGMYFEGYWNEKYSVGKRKNSIFFAGNFRVDHYGLKENENLFGVINRLNLYNFLVQKGLVTEKNSAQELDDFIGSEEDNKFILVNISKGYKIHYSKVRYYDSCFDFMFAFPGVLMPLCHNIVEIMSVGTIPFIQSAYAAVVQPPLIDGETCITFEGLDDVEQRMAYALSLPQSKVQQLRANVQKYHDTHMSPSAIVKTLKSGDYDHVSLLAEYHSVSLLG